MSRRPWSRDEGPLEEARRRVRIHEGILQMGTVFELLAMAGVMGIVLWILL